MVDVFIGIGSNLGNREENIRKAIDFLKENTNIKVEKTSSIIETEPVGGPHQPKYLNGVIKIRTDYSAKDLLKILQDIENKLGRSRITKFGPRTMDLDILLYGNQVIDEPDIKIPHPRMFERDFVVKPLLEIEPNIQRLVNILKYK